MRHCFPPIVILNTRFLSKLRFQLENKSFRITFLGQGQLVHFIFYLEIIIELFFYDRRRWSFFFFFLLMTNAWQTKYMYNTNIEYSKGVENFQINFKGVTCTDSKWIFYWDAIKKTFVLTFLVNIFVFHLEIEYYSFTIHQHSIAVNACLAWAVYCLLNFARTLATSFPWAVWVGSLRSTITVVNRLSSVHIDQVLWLLIRLRALFIGARREQKKKNYLGAFQVNCFPFFFVCDSLLGLFHFGKWIFTLAHGRKEHD